VASVLGDWASLEQLRRGAPEPEPDREWREALLQVHLFAGFPRQVETLEVVERAGGIGPLDADERRAEADQPERGQELFGRIYGVNADAVRARLRALHAEFADWIFGHAYGRVLARPGLAARQRELLALSALSVLGQDRQLASHVRGAILCGATPDEVFRAIEIASEWMNADLTERAQAVARRFVLDAR